MADTGLHFSSAIRMLPPARHGHSAVVHEEVKVEGIQLGIADVGNQSSAACSHLSPNSRCGAYARLPVLPG